MFFDDSDSKYKMILDHNTFNDLVWNESDRNVAYESSGAYSSNQILISEYNWDSSLGPTVLTTAEVNAITGRENFDPTNFGDKTYYFDSLSAYQEAT